MKWGALLVMAILACILAFGDSVQSPAPGDSAATSGDTLKIELGPYPTALNLRAMIISGRLTPTKVVALSKSRVDEVRRSNTDYGALIGWVTDIDSQLRHLKTVVPQTAPLYGVPVVVKDNIAIRGEPTTAGSLALRTNIATHDAPVVAALRKAGALIIARTNLSEWANFRDNRSTSGWSSVGGQTGNAYDPSRTPCGSSSGSAVAVALGYSPVALGTETDGSIICPAAMNGLVGIKPTRQLISQAGVVPLAKSQDVVGPMARTVKDAALLLSVMLKDEHVHRAAAISQAATKPTQLGQLRLGIIQNLGHTNRVVNAAFSDLQDKLIKEGVQLIPVTFPGLPQLSKAEIQTLYFEFQRDLNAYLKAHRNRLPIDSLAALIEYNQVHADRVMPHFGQYRFIQATRIATMSENSYQVARQLAHKLAGPDGLDRLLKTHQLDALLAPSNGPAWTIDYAHGDRYEVGSSSPSAVSGYPAMTIPMTQFEGLPIGVSIMGPQFGDAALISLGAAIEAVTGGFVPPKLRQASPQSPRFRQGAP
ncbi:MAG: amidase family protein [Myxococcota bacterium]|nr:amidase family protein [Myxococcota bacterium]